MSAFYLMSDRKPIVKVWVEKQDTYKEPPPYRTFFVEDRNFDHKNIFKLLKPTDVVEFILVEGYDGNRTHISQGNIDGPPSGNIGKVGYVLEPVKLMTKVHTAKELDDYLHTIQDFKFTTLCFNVNDEQGTVEFKSNYLKITLPTEKSKGMEESADPLESDGFNYFLAQLKVFYPSYHEYYNELCEENRFGDILVFSEKSLVCIFPHIDLYEYFHQNWYSETLQLLFQ